MVDIFYYLLQILAGLIIFLTLWGFLPLNHWWVRGVDFPRIQFIAIGLFSATGLLFFLPRWQIGQWLLMLALIIAVLGQLRMVLPYTRLWNKEVKSARSIKDAVQVKIMVSNVLTPNNNTQALVELVLQKQPDILITLESDKKWEQALNDIEKDFPYRVKVPLDNLYGMHLYCKFELVNPKVKYLVVDDIPSIHTQFKLPNGKLIWLYCLHPMPPSPTEADKSTTRDAELLMVGNLINANKQPAIVAGDLNDVAWSKTSVLFKRISGLLDPRIGRFFINSFHAKYPFLRWALDHIFHSPCFTVVEIERLPYIGSDHFPVMTTLQYEIEVLIEQAENIEPATSEDKQATIDRIEEGKDEGVKLSLERKTDS